MIKYLLLFIVLAYSALAYDGQKIIEYNNTQLPQYGIITLDLSFEPNSTLSIRQKDVNPHVNLTFLPTINITTVPMEFNITFAIENFSLEDDQYLNTSLNITNNFNNYSVHYGLIFLIKKIKPPIISINSTLEFQLLETGYNITISTDLLPFNGSKKFRAVSQSGVLLRFVRCDEWLYCPENFTTASNESVFNVSFLIPYNLSVGEYRKNFEAMAGNVSRLGSFIFNIIEPQISVSRYVFEESCFDNEESLKKCIDEQQEFLYRLVEERTKLGLLKENLTIVKNVTVEKLVLVGSVDTEIKRLYDSALQQNDEFRKSIGEKNDKIYTLQNENQNLNYLTNKLSKDINLTIAYHQNRTAYLLRQEKDKVRKNLYIGATILLVIGLAALSLKLHSHYNMQDTW